MPDVFEVLKALLKEHVEVEDNEIHIKRKKELAYMIFNLVERYDPDFIERLLTELEYEGEEKN